MTWRFQLLSLPDRTWIDRNVPLQGAQVTEAISGPGAITGYLPRGYANRAAVREWGALLIADQDGSNPVACIVDTVSTEGPRLKVDAGGFSMYPTGMPWVDADYAGIQVDPLDVFRMVWGNLQGKAGGDLKVVLDATTSTARLGTPEDPKLTSAKAGVAAAASVESSAKSAYNTAATAKTNAKVALLAAVGLPASGLVLYQDSAPSGTQRSTKNLWVDKNDANKGYVWNGRKWVLQTVATQTTINSKLADYNNATTTSQKDAWTAAKKKLSAAKAVQSAITGGQAVPFTLTWWETHDLGTVLDTLAKDTPFDYRERSDWDGSDNITHQLQLGAPTLGGRRADLPFVVGVNVTVPPPLLERDYASEVYVLGSGNGRAMISATATGNSGRVRRATVVQLKDVTKKDQAATAARLEVAKRNAEGTFTTLEVKDHPNAPRGSYRTGDMVHVVGDAGWAWLDNWVRILAINTDCTTGAINLKVEAA